jgi:hypothetical protein
MQTIETWARTVAGRTIAIWVRIAVPALTVVSAATEAVVTASATGKYPAALVEIAELSEVLAERAAPQRGPVARAGRPALAVPEAEGSGVAAAEDKQFTISAATQIGRKRWYQ